MSKDKAVVTAAIRVLRNEKAAYTGHPYQYVDRGGTDAFAKLKFYGPAHFLEYLVIFFNCIIHKTFRVKSFFLSVLGVCWTLKLLEG
jgi:hypothetical protein